MVKKFPFLIVVLSFAIGLVIYGCAQKPTAANSNEAISHAQTLSSLEEQGKYLAKEANAFINSQQFDEAIKTAKYILGKIDGESAQAKSIIEKATAEIQKLAEKKAEEMKADLKNKLGNIGK